MKIRFLLSIILLALTACGQPDEGVATPEPPAPAAQAIIIEKSACELQTEAYAARTDLIVEPVVKLHIERHSQRIIRKDCRGRVLSDREETVRNPRGALNLSLQRHLRHKANAMSVLNPLTCAAVGTSLPNFDLPVLGLLSPVTGNEKGQIRIKADLSPAVFTFQLEEGMNQIYYTYYSDCLPQEVGQRPSRSNEKFCPQANELQAGIFQVDVKYTEKTLNDVRVVEPTPEECARRSQ